MRAFSISFVGAFIFFVINYHQIRSQQKQLEKQKKEIQECYEKLEKFVQGFSHELRNPLNSLKGNLELASQKNQDKEVSKFLEISQICTQILL